MLYNILQNADSWLDEMGLYSLLQVLYQLEFRAFSAVLLSFGLVLLCGRPVIRWLLRQKIGDAPEFYRDDLNELMASKAVTPTMGGLVICGSIAVTTLLFADLNERYVHLALTTLVWLAVLGGVDDWLKLTSDTRHPGSREGLYAWEKLLFQLGIAFIVGIFLYRHAGGQGLLGGVQTLSAGAIAVVAGFLYENYGRFPAYAVCAIIMVALAVTAFILSGSQRSATPDDPIDVNDPANAVTGHA